MYGCLSQTANPQVPRGGTVLWHGPSNSISPGKLRLMLDISKPLGTVSPLDGSIGYLAFALKWCSSSLGKSYSLLALVRNLQDAWTSPHRCAAHSRSAGLRWSLEDIPLCWCPAWPAFRVVPAVQDGSTQLLPESWGTCWELQERSSKLVLWLIVSLGNGASVVCRLS